MTYADQKVIAYYANSAYSSHKKKEMPVDDFFRVRDVVKTNKSMGKFMKNLHDKNNMGNK